MANDWAEAAWVVKTLQKKFKLNENAKEYTEKLNNIQNNIDSIILQKLTIVDTETEDHVPSNYADTSEQPYQDTIWFILSQEEDS